ncbi:SIS domain-containing protein [Clostridium sp. CF012]|uniref:SIS domain-containing protein n=1 Tax=Clostridium sp. CF012 TaxID=2843319 RepID=UPI001C0B7603|nr:SIS domain-containing protein [Clostridium sp. CF012]MBU3145150.1 SIS domain-containing protein [Clostridium sp. CF012]
MEKIFGFTQEDIKEKSMTYTVNEINRQPKVWTSIYDKISYNREKIKNFMNYFDSDTRIVFMGAGSSAFIGDSLAPLVRKEFRFSDVESIHTTDIVASPSQYFVRNVKTVLVSFGRSGDSPESIAAIEIAEKHINNLYHIIITCNPLGKLAGYKNERTLNLVFDEINDEGFAMTSSVTGMMLAAYSIFAIERDLKEDVSLIASYAKEIIMNKYSIISEVFEKSVNRLIVLGSANLFGAARESALKSIELTRGKVMSWYDTPMGFRHGPKSLLTDNTVILFFVSNNEYTRKYDIDMLIELAKSKKHKLLVVSDKYYFEVEDNADVYIYNSMEKIMSDAFTPYSSLLVAQIFALFASLKIGCTPDNPFPSGEVNRVVKGVLIH